LLGGRVGSFWVSICIFIIFISIFFICICIFIIFVLFAWFFLGGWDYLGWVISICIIIFVLFAWFFFRWAGLFWVGY